MNDDRLAEFIDTSRARWHADRDYRIRLLREARPAARQNVRTLRGRVSGR